MRFSWNSIMADSSNHDQPRYPHLVQDRAVSRLLDCADTQLLKNAAVYPFINDGYPIVYQGQEHVGASARAR